jgi:hypothetical protein
MKIGNDFTRVSDIGMLIHINCLGIFSAVRKFGLEMIRYLSKYVRRPSVCFVNWADKNWRL